MLNHEQVYGEGGACVAWKGAHVSDDGEFRRYMAERVRVRFYDLDERDRFEADMRALVTSDMGSAALEALLLAEPGREAWEVGEALAECLLADEGANWPSHTGRDKRTPKASLPGADIIGFIGEGDDVRLALGEVKTSGESASPPGVMSGRSGMVHQLDELARRLDIHRCVLQWLRSRCHGTPAWPSFQQAARRYLASGGKDVALFGMLMRDTEPSELDLKGRAEALSQSVSAPTSVALAAWYLPRPIREWLELVGRAS